MPAGKVIIAGGPTTLSLPPDHVLEAAVGRLKSVIVVGIDEDGEDYYSSSVGAAEGGDAKVNLMIDKFKRYLIEQQYPD